MSELPRLAVVGHTNAGKTSLLRTLTRDARFGEVSERPATTRHVEAVELMADGDAVLQLFDTPGMEDALGLADLMDELTGDGKPDGPELIERFLASPQARGRFEQEAKVLRQMRASDAGLYVIDARDPVLAKFREELAILSRCARPLLPVLNFVATPGHREAEWREMLARLGLHAVVAFDSVAPAIDGERRLFTALGTLIEAHRQTLARLTESRAAEALARVEAGRRMIAELLVDVAALRLTLDDESREQAVLVSLRDRVRTRERTLVASLLELYDFGRDQGPDEALPELAGRWEDDLFSAEALRAAGVRVGTGAAAGAAAGMGIDLVTGGLTLGAAAALGALAGGLWQTVSHYGERLGGKLRGYRQLSVDDAIVRLLALRSQRLLEALERRGHAAVERVSLAPTDESSWRVGTLPGALAEARIHPEWSAIGTGFEASAERSATIAELSGAIHVGRPPIKE